MITEVAMMGMVMVMAIEKGTFEQKESTIQQK